MEHLFPSISSLRRSAARVLCCALTITLASASFGGSDGVRDLLAQLDVSPTQPSEILSAVDKIGKLGDGSQSELFSFVNSPNSPEPLRTKVILLLCFCSNKSGVVGCFTGSIRKAASSDAAAETGAVSGLATGGRLRKETEDFISAALTRHEPEVLAPVMRLAITQGDTQAVGRLTEIIYTPGGFDLVTRARAARAIAILTHQDKLKMRDDLLEKCNQTESAAGITDELVHARALLGEPNARSKLVGDLASTDEEVRFSSITTLSEITGDDLGFRFNDSAGNRRLAVDRWRKWAAIRRNIDGTAAE